KFGAFKSVRPRQSARVEEQKLICEAQQSAAMWTLNAIRDAILLLCALLSLTSLNMSTEDAGFKAAVHEARQGSNEGGVPIGACLVSAEGKILGQG
nr:hypothetical protein [Tanacetum cinerariifolium]